MSVNTNRSLLECISHAKALQTQLQKPSLTAEEQANLRIDLGLLRLNFESLLPKDHSLVISIANLHKKLVSHADLSGIKPKLAILQELRNGKQYI